MCVCVCVSVCVCAAVREVIVTYRGFCLLHLASYEVSEALIVRDLIFTFQGIDGKYIHYNQDEDGFRVDPQVCGGLVAGPTLPLSLITCHCTV